MTDKLTNTKFLRNIFIEVFNKIVKNYFKDVNDDDDDIKQPRTALKKACTVLNNDSQIMINNRMMLFYFILRQAQDLQAPIYGIPIGTYHENFKFKPQICLYFREDLSDVEPDYHPLRTQITFRLMKETEDTLSKSKLKDLALKIKNNFLVGNDGYRWKRGKVLCTYFDNENGLALKLFAWSFTEAKEVINKVLDVIDKPFDNTKFNYSENDNPSKSYPIIPKNKIILGKTYKEPRKRPVGYVRFQYATCQIWGIDRPIVLFDYTGRFKKDLLNDN